MSAQINARAKMIGARPTAASSSWETGSFSKRGVQKKTSRAEKRALRDILKEIEMEETREALQKQAGAAEDDAPLAPLTKEELEKLTHEMVALTEAFEGAEMIGPRYTLTRQHAVANIRGLNKTRSIYEKLNRLDRKMKLTPSDRDHLLEYARYELYKPKEGPYKSREAAMRDVIILAGRVVEARRDMQEALSKLKEARTAARSRKWREPELQDDEWEDEFWSDDDEDDEYAGEPIGAQYGSSDRVGALIKQLHVAREAASDMSLPAQEPVGPDINRDPVKKGREGAAKRRAREQAAARRAELRRRQLEIERELVQLEAEEAEVGGEDEAEVSVTNQNHIRVMGDPRHNPNFKPKLVNLNNAQAVRNIFRVDDKKRDMYIALNNQFMLVLTDIFRETLSPKMDARERHWAKLVDQLIKALVKYNAWPDAGMRKQIIDALEEWEWNTHGTEFTEDYYYLNRVVLPKVKAYFASLGQQQPAAATTSGTTAQDAVMPHIRGKGDKISLVGMIAPENAVKLFKWGGRKTFPIHTPFTPYHPYSEEAAYPFLKLLRDIYEQTEWPKDRDDDEGFEVESPKNDRLNAAQKRVLDKLFGKLAEFRQGRLRVGKDVLEHIAGIMAVEKLNMQGGDDGSFYTAHSSPGWGFANDVLRRAEQALGAKNTWPARTEVLPAAASSSTSSSSIDAQLVGPDINRDPIKKAGKASQAKQQARARIAARRAELRRQQLEIERELAALDAEDDAPAAGSSTSTAATTSSSTTTSTRATPTTQATTLGLPIPEPYRLEYPRAQRGYWPGVDNLDWAALARQLKEGGYVIFPMLTKLELALFKERFLVDTYAKMPELNATNAEPFATFRNDGIVYGKYKTPRVPLNPLAESPKFTIGMATPGAFGAINMPSANHTPFAREMRMITHLRTQRLFQELAKLLAREANAAGIATAVTHQHIYDRWVTRKYGAQQGRESTHRDLHLPAVGWPILRNQTWGRFRDVRLKATCFGHVFGGWVGTHDRGFSAAPGSHTAPAIQPMPAVPAGFKHTNKEHGFSTADKAMFKRWDPYIQQIHVPAGSVVIFYQTLIHKVHPGKTEINPYGLWLHVTSNLCVWKKDELRELRSQNGGALPEAFGNGYVDMIIDNKALSMLPSAQTPGIYSSNHSSNFPEIVNAFASGLDERLVQRGFQSSGGYRYDRPRFRFLVYRDFIREAPALAYSAQDREVMKPRLILE